MPRRKPSRPTGTRQVLGRLARYESRNVTYLKPERDWPIVWEKARGSWVWDPEGRRYLDLTAAFGVAAAGHANRAVVAAAQKQMQTLLHAMGDVHPHRLKAELAQLLSELTFGRWSQWARKNRDGSNEMEKAGIERRTLKEPGFSIRASRLAAKGLSSRSSPARRGKTLFCNSGFEAVEAALKTAHLATGRPRVIAFEGAYHGLGYGALNATHRPLFRSPFQRQLGRFADFVPFPARAAELDDLIERIDRIAAKQQTGAVLVEPIQGRGGIRLPPLQMLPRLRQCCDQHGMLLICDEVYTGFGRTGRWFACEESGTVPDLICLGKALTGGFPLSACVGEAELMDAAWPVSEGEAIHTSTYLGHPVGCAMAMAQVAEIRRQRLVTRSRVVGRELREQLKTELSAINEIESDIRGRGLMVGVSVRPRSIRADVSLTTRFVTAIVERMLQRGYLCLPEGEHGEVIGLTPPLTIERRPLAGAVAALGDVIQEVLCG